MKKQNLAALAIIGLTAGLMHGCQKKPVQKTEVAASTAAMDSDTQAFYSSLSSEAQEKFLHLDARHKMMAVEMANQECNGKNMCQGMGGCANDKNACAAQNSCKGQGGPPVNDPNRAVEAQFQSQIQRQRTHPA